MDLDKLNIKQLKNILKKNGIKKYSKLNKKDLIDLIKKCDKLNKELDGGTKSSGYIKALVAGKYKNDKFNITAPSKDKNYKLISKYLINKYGNKKLKDYVKTLKMNKSMYKIEIDKLNKLMKKNKNKLLKGKVKKEVEKIEKKVEENKKKKLVNKKKEEDKKENRGRKRKNLKKDALNNEEYKKLYKEREDILNIKPKDRTAKQKNRYQQIRRRMNYLLKGTGKDDPSTPKKSRKRPRNPPKIKKKRKEAIKKREEKRAKLERLKEEYERDSDSETTDDEEAEMKRAFMANPLGDVEDDGAVGAVEVEEDEITTDEEEGDGIKWGSFTKSFNKLKKLYPHTKINNLEEFSNYIIENKDEAPTKLYKRALFYKNVLKGGNGRRRRTTASRARSPSPPPPQPPQPQQRTTTTRRLHGGDNNLEGDGKDGLVSDVRQPKRGRISQLGRRHPPTAEEAELLLHLRRNAGREHDRRVREKAERRADQAILRAERAERLRRFEAEQARYRAEQARAEAERLRARVSSNVDGEDDVELGEDYSGWGKKIVGSGTIYPFDDMRELVFNKDINLDDYDLYPMAKEVVENLRGLVGTPRESRIEPLLRHLEADLIKMENEGTPPSTMPTGSGLIDWFKSKFRRARVAPAPQPTEEERAERERARAEREARREEINQHRRQQLREANERARRDRDEEEARYRRQYLMEQQRITRERRRMEEEQRQRYLRLIAHQRRREEEAIERNIDEYERSLGLMRVGDRNIKIADLEEMPSMRDEVERLRDEDYRMELGEFGGDEDDFKRNIKKYEGDFHLKEGDGYLTGKGVKLIEKIEDLI